MCCTSSLHASAGDDLGLSVSRKGMLKALHTSSVLVTHLNLQFADPSRLKLGNRTQTRCVHTDRKPWMTAVARAGCRTCLLWGFCMHMKCVVMRSQAGKPSLAKKMKGNSISNAHSRQRLDFAADFIVGLA